MPALEKSVIVDELKLVRDLVVAPETKANGFGAFTASKMKTTQDFVISNIGLGDGKAPEAEDLYATGFLPIPPVTP